MNLSEYKQRFAAICAQVGRALVGQEELTQDVVLALVCRGHVLLEGAPGLGKTLLVRTLGEVLGCQFKRIQFTPDLMPSDVTGQNVFNQQRNEFVFGPGPVFTQLLLADEINRAPAKTQSALLEAMQERTVSVDGVSHVLPEPFFVIATQNPIESQGTYPLPEAQLDRFLFKLLVQSPSVAVEKAILREHLKGFDPNQLQALGLRTEASPQILADMHAATRFVRVDETILDYITAMVGQTRAHRNLTFGASPRASIALLMVARARAASQERDFVVPDDVKAQAPAVLRHRVGVHPDAEIEGFTADDCIAEILREVRVPHAAP